MAKRRGIMEVVARRPAHRPSRRLSKARAKQRDGVPGPSDNPLTNLILADVAISALSFLARRGVERSLLTNRYGKQTAKKIVKNKTLGQSLLSVALARVATRSVPGAILVSGGALAKALSDRRRSRRRAQAEGDAKLLEQARDD